MLFSATMTKKVAKLQRASLKDPVKVRLQILLCSYSGFDTGLEHSCHPLFRIWIRDHVLVFFTPPASIRIRDKFFSDPGPDLEFRIPDPTHIF
jgi:hypothetical protein